MDNQAMDNQWMDGKRVAGYFWFGIGVGALAGILLAPKPGAETRDRLKRKLQEGKDRAQRKARELQQYAEDLVESGKGAPERVVAAFEAGREAYRREMSRTQ